MKKAGLWVLFAIVMFSAAVPAAAGGRKGGEAPAPRLVTPTDNADITGKNSLEFRWTTERGGGSLEYYDFRLYKGSQTIESGIMLKEKVPAGKTDFSVGADKFEDGQIYCWSVRPMGSKKGRSNYSIFKIKK